MKKRIAKLAAAVSVAAAVPLVGGVIQPAHATACLWTFVGTWTIPAQSTVMNSSATCDNLWAARTRYYADYIRGQYNNRDGSGWHYSREGKKLIHPYKTQKKIIDDTTVTGERDRGVSQRYDQLVRYAH